MLKFIGVKRFLCGNDFRFGKDRKGDINTLVRYFHTKIITDITHNGKRISSTLIKEKIKNGDISNANIMLNKNYHIKGKVIKGNQMGRTLGYKTANIKPDNIIIPAPGVYITKVKIGLLNHLSLTNIGYNPTINKQDNLRIETHIINFNREIYGKNIKIQFIKYLRAEQKFNTKEELIAQLEDDIINAKSL